MEVSIVNPNGGFYIVSPNEDFYIISPSGGFYIVSPSGGFYIVNSLQYLFVSVKLLKHALPLQMKAEQ